MERDDFYSLRIGQEIYCSNIKYKIKGKYLDEDEHRSFMSITIHSEDNIVTSHHWPFICEKCSLEPPKEKKKYWKWIIKPKNSKTPFYASFFDDKGISICGRKFQHMWGYIWEEIDKKKIESVFWEE